MRVCLMSPHPPPSGGMAVWTDSVVKYSGWPESLQFVFVDTAVRWRSLNNDAGPSVRVIGGSFQAVRDIFKLTLALVVRRPALVHLCTSGSLVAVRDIVVLCVCRIFAVPGVLHVHMGRLPDAIARGSWEWKLVRRAMLCADVVVLLDRSSEAEVRKSLPGKVVRTIPNPIDLSMVEEVLSKPCPGGPEKRVVQVVYVGQIIPSKGIRELVSACRSIDSVAFGLSLVGNVQDDFRAELMRLAAGGKQADWLQFQGTLSREGAMAWMRDAGVFVLPSYAEGFPLVVLEAMALGRPIIATGVGAIPEMLDRDTDAPCGILIKPRDAAGLQEAIVDLLHNPSTAGMYGARARAKAVKEYSSDRVMQAYLEMWKGLAAR